MGKDGSSQYKSKYYDTSQFYSKDGNNDNFRIDSMLVSKLDQLTTAIGKKANITSGYRSEEHNANVGGAKNSYHMKGMAVDVSFPGMSVDQVAAMAKKIGFTGIIKYYKSGFVHLDTRPTPYYGVGN